jgi:ABC-type dipeptide/oligopeptide/nickel transport system permease subunit
MAVAAPPQNIEEEEFQDILMQPKRGYWQDAWDRLKRNKAAVVGMVIIGFFILLSLFANVVAPRNPLEINSGMQFRPPVFMDGYLNKKADARFFFGTDYLGRDVLSRVIYGSRVSLIAGILPTIVIVLVGVVVGVISGFIGGRTDNLLMRLTDVFYAFPDLLFFIILIIVLKDTPMGEWLSGLFILFMAIAITGWVGMARLVRGLVLSLKEKEFVEAARAIGAPTNRIMFRHILPNALGPIIIVTCRAIPGFIILEAVFGYLGLGLKPATDPASFFISSWGSLMLDGRTALTTQPWLLLAPALCVALIVIAFTFLGDGLRDALDPRLRGRQ